MTSRLIAFVHVPKSGGIAATRYVNAVGTDLVWYTDLPGWHLTYLKDPAGVRRTLAARPEVRYATGHCPVGLHRLLPDWRVDYWTLVRDPAERVWSAISVLTRPDARAAWNEAWQAIKGRDAPQRDWQTPITEQDADVALAWMESARPACLSDFTTRMILGLRSDEQVGSDHGAQAFDALGGFLAAVRSDRMRDLGVAQALCERLGLPVPGTVSVLNQTARRPPLMAAVADRIRRSNKADATLYELLARADNGGLYPATPRPHAGVR